MLCQSNGTGLPRPAIRGAGFPRMVSGHVAKLSVDGAGSAGGGCAPSGAFGCLHVSYEQLNNIKISINFKKF